jgi:hypothetical protein
MQCAVDKLFWLWLCRFSDLYQISSLKRIINIFDVEKRFKKRGTAGNHHDQTRSEFPLFDLKQSHFDQLTDEHTPETNSFNCLSGASSRTH